MSDQVYRQQRKHEPVNPSEVTGEQPNRPEVSLNDVLAMQRQAGVDTPQEKQPQPAAVPSYGNVQPRPKEGINVTGNIPPAMQQMLKQRLSEVENEQDNSPQQRQPAFQEQRQPLQPQVSPTPQGIQQGQMYTNDPALNALLGSINTQIYEPVVLPSLGRFYTDADQPTSGEVNIRPMTGQEETILSTTRFMRQGRGIEMIFRNCLQERNINPERLLSIDRTYLLIFLRAISYGNMYEVTVKCPECGHSFDYDIDLGALQKNYCPQDFSVDSLRKVLPRSGFSFKYRLMTGADENEVTAYRERKTKSVNTPDDSFLYRAAVLIEEMGNEKAILNNRYAIHSLLERLPVSDVNFIRNALNKPPFGVETEMDVDCISCGHRFPVELPYESNFFFPQEKPETLRQ